MEWVRVSRLALTQFCTRVAPAMSESRARVYLWHRLQPHAADRPGVTVLTLATDWGPIRLLVRRTVRAGRAPGRMHWRLDLQMVLGPAPASAFSHAN